MSLEILGGLKSVARVCSGMWGYLSERVKWRGTVELEHARNHGTAEAIRLLPPGAELFENEPNGRTRIIRMPHHASNPLLINATEAPPTATPSIATPSIAIPTSAIPTSAIPTSAASEHEPLAITAPPTTSTIPALTDAPPMSAPPDEAPTDEATGREQQ